jgi:hypothetical protein
MLLATLLAINPLGSDLISAAFFSGEALSQNIWGPIVLIAMAGMALMTLVEWRLRVFIFHRRAHGTTAA